MSDYELPDEIYWQQQEQAEQEAAHEAEQEAARLEHARCTTLCELVYVEIANEHDWLRYYANYECKECGLWERSEISLDDFLYHRNRGINTYS